MVSNQEICNMRTVSRVYNVVMYVVNGIIRVYHLSLNHDLVVQFQT